MARAIGTLEERFLRYLESYLADHALEWARRDEFREHFNWSDAAFDSTLERLRDQKKIRYQGYGSGRLQLATPPQAAKKTGLDVFVSYAHRDADYCRLLREHLSPLVRSGAISIWHDGEIDAGEQWNAEILKNLGSCDVCIVLVSASFIDSRYCYEEEFKQALERARKDEVVILPVLVRNCMWEETPLKDIQHAGLGGKAISSMPNIDEAFTTVAKAIAKAVEKRLGAMT